jgi:hypothetical protein
MSTGAEELEEQMTSLANEVDRVVVEGTKAHNAATRATAAFEAGVKQADDVPSVEVPVALAVCLYLIVQLCCL